MGVIEFPADQFDLVASSVASGQVSLYGDEVRGIWVLMQA